MCILPPMDKNTYFFYSKNYFKSIIFVCLEIINLASERQYLHKFVLKNNIFIVVLNL